MRTDAEVVELFRKWLMASKAETLIHFLECRCAPPGYYGQRCSGHVKDKKRDGALWPETEATR